MPVRHRPFQPLKCAFSVETARVLQFIVENWERSWSRWGSDWIITSISVLRCLLYRHVSTSVSLCKRDQWNSQLVTSINIGSVALLLSIARLSRRTVDPCPEWLPDLVGNCVPCERKLLPFSFKFSSRTDSLVVKSRRKSKSGLSWATWRRQ